MKQKKHRLELFSFYDWQSIQTHLEKQAAKGWMLDSCDVDLWKYHRIEPTKLRFAVSYFEKAGDLYDPAMTETQKDYIALCEQVGWRYVTQWQEMLIFCSEAEGCVPIETDPVVQVNHIHKTMKKTYLFGAILALVSLAIILGLLVWNMARDPLEILSDNYMLLAVVVICVFTLFGLFDLMRYLHWHRRAVKKAQEEGQLLPLLQGRTLTFVALITVGAIVIVLWGMTGRGWRFWYAVARGGLYIGIVVLLTFVRNKLRKKGMSAHDNRGWIVLTAFLLFTAFQGVIPTADELNLNRTEEYKDVKGVTRAAYLDELPLEVGDLMEAEVSDYSRRMVKDAQTFLAIHQIAEQQPRHGVKGYELFYERVASDFPSIYKELEADYLEKYMSWWKLDEMDASLWSAKKAYQMVKEHDYDPWCYIILWDSSFAFIRVDWEPTPEQIQVIVEKLKTS